MRPNAGRAPLRGVFALRVLGVDGVALGSEGQERVGDSVVVVAEDVAFMNEISSDRLNT
jgi:hypothetical protein